MQRFCLSALLTLTLVLGFAACGGSGTPADGGPDATDGDTADGDDGGGDLGGPGDDGSGGDPGLTDGGGDPGGDPGGGDPGGADGGFPEPVWGWCPTAADYVGGAWDWTLHVTPEALYCATFNESRTLEEELPVKALLRLVEGDYPLPSSAGDYSFRLPLCLRFAEADAQPLLAEAGTLHASFNVYGSDLYYQYNLSQPLRTAGGEAWEFQFSLWGVMPPGQTAVTLDGDHASQCSADVAFGTSMTLCQTSCQEWIDVRWFDSCTFDSVDPGLHHLAFQGGSLELELRIGCSMASTEPALFARASGTLDGAAFDQRNYWRLVYNPEHHHFSRNAAVLFDAPIGGACGLAVHGLNPYCCLPQTAECPEACSGTLATVDCALVPIEPRTITAESWER